MITDLKTERQIRAEKIAIKLAEALKQIAEHDPDIKVTGLQKAHLYSLLTTWNKLNGSPVLSPEQVEEFEVQLAAHQDAIST
jgi:hypothetical protein